MIPIKSAAAIVAFFSLIAAIAAVSEIRPSEHGLEFQSPPPAGEKSSPEMRSFFGGITSPTPEVALPIPNTMNSSESPGWWNHRDGGNKRLRNALLVATAACGITGVTLLVGSTLFYIFKAKNKRSLPLSTNNNHK
uniref:Transmembrane protein n=1 Tax=Cucumis melo TaxID=3656 RepID=A0A9I9CQU8_CUCME